jgi:hypothetical protein
MLSADGALLVAVEMQKVAHSFREIPDCIDGYLDTEVGGVGIGYGNLICEFPAAIEVA